MILMIFYVFLDNIFRHFVAHCTSKISIFPEFASPQFPFHFRIYLEYCSGRSSLQALYNIRYRIFRRKSQKYMNMIFRNFQRFYLKIMGHRYLFEALFNKIPKITSQYPFTVFRGPHDMVSRIVCSMTCPSNSHAYNLRHLNFILKDNVSSSL